MLSRIKLWLMRQRLAEFKLRIEAFKEQAGSSQFAIAGETYEHHEALRAAGGEWNAENGAWEFRGTTPQQVIEALSPDRDPDDISAAGKHVAANPAAGLAETMRTFSHDLAPPIAEPQTPVSRRHAGRKTVSPASEVRKHYHGHRERLRQRFRHAGHEALADYELLEMLLFFCIPRRDVKPLAKSLIDRFGSLADLLAQPIASLEQIEELKGQPAILLATAQSLSARAMRDNLKERPLLDRELALHRYVSKSLGYKNTESLHILLLNSTKHLIRELCLSSGHEDKTPFSSKQIVREALNHGATSVIMVHNHPSGDPTPSRADMTLTAECQLALDAMHIELIDHLIVARDQCVSLRALNMMQSPASRKNTSSGFRHESPANGPSESASP